MESYVLENVNFKNVVCRRMVIISWYLHLITWAAIINSNYMETQSRKCRMSLSTCFSERSLASVNKALEYHNFLIDCLLALVAFLSSTFGKAYIWLSQLPFIA